MGRPLKQGLDFFPHDCDASFDPKIERLRAAYGNDGYAFYFILLEVIYSQPDCHLVCDKTMCEILARRTHLSPRRFRQVLETSLELELFDLAIWKASGNLVSKSILERKEVIIARRQKRREERTLPKPDPRSPQTTPQTLPQIPPQSPPQDPFVAGLWGGLSHDKVPLPYKEKDLKPAGQDSSGQHLPPSNVIHPAVAGAAVDAVVALFRASLGREPSSLELVDLEQWAGKFSIEQLQYAFRESAQLNRLSLSYVAGILRRLTG